MGPDEERLVAHKHILTTASDFFKRALTGPYEEAASDTVRLPADCPDVVALFLRWLYLDHLGSLGSVPDALQECAWAELLRLYVFADAKVIPCLKDDIVTNICEGRKTVLNVADVAKAYTELPQTDPIRGTLVSHFISTLKHDEDLGKILNDEWPPEFVVDLAVKLFKARQEVKQDVKPSRARCTTDEGI